MQFKLVLAHYLRVIFIIKSTFFREFAATVTEVKKHYITSLCLCSLKITTSKSTKTRDMKPLEYEKEYLNFDERPTGYHLD